MAVKTRDLALCALFAAVISICSWITIPAAVPFTLQTFAVFLSVGLLGGKRGTVAVLVYILLGAAGLPVFHGFTGGLGILLGSTGGYILGFLGAALVMRAFERFFGGGLPALLFSMLAGLFVCYLFGTAWFAAFYLRTTGPVTLAQVFTWCVLPFIAPDLLKIALALLLVRRLKRHVPT